MESASRRLTQEVILTPNPNPYNPHACLDCGIDCFSTGISVEKERGIKNGVICQRCMTPKYRLNVSLGIVRQV